MNEELDLNVSTKPKVEIDIRYVGGRKMRVKLNVNDEERDKNKGETDAKADRDGDERVIKVDVNYKPQLNVIVENKM